MTRRRRSVMASLAGLAVAILVPAIGTAQTPSPIPSEPTSSLPIPPTRLERVVVAEQDGIRLRIELERNPMPAGRPLSARITLTNIGRDTLSWQRDSCAIPVYIRGEMVDATWRPGEPSGPTDYTGLKWRASEWWSGGNPEIRLNFWPAKYFGQGQIACSDVATGHRLQPGGVLRRRAVWDGMASPWLGPPPDGLARLTATFDYYDRPSLEGGYGNHDFGVELDAWVVGGRDPDMLHPMEIVDAALTDLAFAAWVDAVKIGDGSDHFIRYDPGSDRWEVGVYFVRTDRFGVAIVDPRTGEVEGIVDRPRGPDEPRPI